MWLWLFLAGKAGGGRRGVYPFITGDERAWRRESEGQYRLPEERC
jgi:hypothetical protein